MAREILYDSIKHQKFSILATVSVFIPAILFSFCSFSRVNALPDDSLATEDDRNFIRRTFELATKAVSRGNYPFGALLVHDGKIVAEYENRVHTSGDVTQHAETGLIIHVSKKLSPEIFAQCTLYTSTEPCIMCCGAIYWANIKKIVFGTSEKQMDLVADYGHKEDGIFSREVFRRMRPETIIIGPVLENEGLAIHKSFFDNLKKKSAN